MLQVSVASAMSCRELLGDEEPTTNTAEATQLKGLLAGVPRGHREINVLSRHDYLLAHQELRETLSRVLDLRTWFSLDEGAALIFPPSLKGKIIVGIRQHIRNPYFRLVVYGGRVVAVRILNQHLERDVPTYRIFLQTPEGIEYFDSIGLIDVYLYGGNQAMTWPAFESLLTPQF